MKFEKQLKKHIDQTLEENVPNPYPKRKPTFPNWLKIAIPISTGVLATSIALAIFVPTALSSQINRAPNNGQTISSQGDKGSKPSSGTKAATDGVSPVAAPKHLGVSSLDTSIVKKTAGKSLEALDAYFQDTNNTDFVLSPASYLLVSSALLAVSDGFEIDRFGLTDPKEETKALLEHWNSYWVVDNNTTIKIDSGILHQQVGPKYAFDENKKKEVEDAYIATSVANRDNYVKQAEEYFKETIGLSVPIPDTDLPDDGGVVSYAAIKLMDLAGATFESANNDFYINGKKTSVNTALIGTKEMPLSNVRYFENEQYEVFSFIVGYTRLGIILPKEGISLESVSVSEAYTNLVSKDAQTVKAYGYVPYFHLKTEGFEFTDTFINNMTGQERFYSQLLKNPDALKANLPGFYICAKQSSDFEFTKFGVFGESVSAIGVGDSAINHQDPIALNVDRPFYAISLDNDFPLFVNKVNNPAK